MTVRSETLIFDLGNVIIDLDFDRTESILSKFGLSFLQPAESDREQFDLFEVGLISEESFLDYFIGKSNHHVTRDTLRNAWTAMLTTIPSERLKMLTKLKDKYQTLILSNTNGMHIRWVNNYLNEHHNIHGLSELVHKAYYSYEVGMRKPDPEIFQFIIQDRGLDPVRTYFFDDDPRNIRSAGLQGLNAIEVGKETTILEVIQQVPRISLP